jgi:mannose-6-phosphate isomerase
MQASEPGVELRAAAGRARDELLSWLLDSAYPLWSTRGLDLVRGGFHESLTLQGEPTGAQRRARVQPRQIFAFSKAPRMGWNEGAARVVSHGLTYFLTRYRRQDGLFRTVVAPDGSPIDDRPVLYDQAFALLAFAAAPAVLGPSFDLPGEGEQLRLAVLSQFHRPGGGFNSLASPGLPLQSNPHMHLLESALAWFQASGLPAWRALADEIGELALRHFIDAQSGGLRENFDDAWAPVQGVAGRIVEPGHQFEWAWMLLNWNGPWREDARKAARRLIEIGENYGVYNGVAVNALLDDFSIHEASARLWPQTERLRAVALAARLFGGAGYWKMTVAAAAGLQRYLKTPLPGVWYDQLLPNGEFVEGPVPAGNLYHIVGAIEELDRLLKD